MPKATIAQPGIHRYALAFYWAIRGERLEPILAEYRMVLELFSAYPDLVHVLNHLLLSEEEKERILTKLIETASISKELASFLRTLIRHRHLEWIQDIYDVIQAFVDNKQNRATAYVKVAVKPTEVQREKIRTRLEALTHKTIDLRVDYDPSILGGVVAQVEHRIFDYSLRNSLNLMKEKMKR